MCLTTELLTVYYKCFLCIWQWIVTDCNYGLNMCCILIWNPKCCDKKMVADLCIWFNFLLWNKMKLEVLLKFVEEFYLQKHWLLQILPFDFFTSASVDVSGSIMPCLCRYLDVSISYQHCWWQLFQHWAQGLYSLTDISQCITAFKTRFMQ